MIEVTFVSGAAQQAHVRQSDILSNELHSVELAPDSSLAKTFQSLLADSTPKLPLVEVTETAHADIHTFVQYLRDEGFQLTNEQWAKLERGV